MSKIYNKNAREKALLEEAYAGVYQESAVDVELDHWWDFDIDDVIRKVYHGARGSLPPEQGTPEYEENSEKIVIWLKDKYPQQTSAVDVELDHWWDFDIDDVIRKVYHDARGTLAPEQGTPEYEENSEKIVIWLKDKYPQQTEDAEDADRTAHATEWAKRQNEKQDLEKMPDLGPHSPGHKRFRNPEEISDWARKHLGEVEDAEGALSNLATGLGRGLGDVVSGVSRAGLAAGGAGFAAAGGALGAALKIAKTLTADQLKALGEYALEKSAENEEDKEEDDDKYKREYTDSYKERLGSGWQN